MNPQHIAIVPDGNRRYARKKGWQLLKGHDLGYSKIEDLINWCRELNIPQLTVWILSTENLKRDKTEVSYLMDLFRKHFDRLGKEQHENKVKIKFIGRLTEFPEDIQEKMQEIMEKTKDNAGLLLTLAAAYGGKAEIVDATKKIAQKVKDGKLQPEEIDEDVVADNLYLKDEPDLIIRTSERRLSGLLPFQSSYAEIIFLPELLWPEFSKEDFTKCVEDFNQRKRRFGN